MTDMTEWKQRIFSGNDFEQKTLEVFAYQFEHNAVYRRYCEAMGKAPADLPESMPYGSVVDEVPLLSVRAFRDAELCCRPADQAELTFKSSGTSGMQRSTHYVAEAELYRQSVLQGFRTFYEPDRMVILGYTPGYADNEYSSLIWMINELIRQDESGMSRFLPLEEPLNPQEVDHIRKAGKQLLLFGPSFGLLDLLEASDLTLPSNSIVMETGGMKTHRREMNRSRLHKTLSEGFGLEINRIHSEYGMAELLSQAYALGGRWFRMVPWMRVTIRDSQAPQHILPAGMEGLIGVVDLANVHSCSFLLTGDRGIMDKRGYFRVMGRWNPKDLRGCNFLIDED